MLPLQSSDGVEGRDLFVVDYPVNAEVRDPVVVSSIKTVKGNPISTTGYRGETITQPQICCLKLYSATNCELMGDLSTSKDKGQ